MHTFGYFQVSGGVGSTDGFLAMGPENSMRKYDDSKKEQNSGSHAMPAIPTPYAADTVADYMLSGQHPNMTTCTCLGIDLDQQNSSLEGCNALPHKLNEEDNWNACTAGQYAAHPVAECYGDWTPVDESYRNLPGAMDDVWDRRAQHYHNDEEYIQMIEQWMAKIPETARFAHFGSEQHPLATSYTYKLSSMEHNLSSGEEYLDSDEPYYQYQPRSRAASTTSSSPEFLFSDPPEVRQDLIIRQQFRAMKRSGVWDEECGLGDFEKIVQGHLELGLEGELQDQCAKCDCFLMEGDGHNEKLCQRAIVFVHGNYQFQTVW
ncbi:hypothetical protein BP5796_00225 [Coleophoma crateriformis]|uniref:Uncharacterized protein n=1 Tax=Coleophoma crateriformis TaxID=565419 RepID=A0A3D8T791_9HELO|nr:hypothetical protein BP5796_00225 [Coleophoma crateriformis]